MRSELMLMPWRPSPVTGLNDPVDVLRPGPSFFEANDEYRVEVGRVVDEVDDLVEAGIIDNVVSVDVLVEVLRSLRISRWDARWTTYLVADIVDCAERWAWIDRPATTAWPQEYMEATIAISMRFDAWSATRSLGDVLAAARRLSAAEQAVVIGSLAGGLAAEG